MCLVVTLSLFESYHLLGLKVTRSKPGPDRGKPVRSSVQQNWKFGPRSGPGWTGGPNKKKFFFSAVFGTGVPFGTARPCQNTGGLPGLGKRHGTAVPVPPQKTGFSAFPPFFRACFLYPLIPLPPFFQIQPHSGLSLPSPTHLHTQTLKPFSHYSLHWLHPSLTTLFSLSLSNLQVGNCLID